MRKLYDALSTKIILNKVLPSNFRIVNDKNSNGYRFFNALYGIELDSLKDYLDQAKHFISFENFDYGYDFDVQILKIPEVISSGYIYGDGNIPIKITNTETFYDGVITRFVYDDVNSIETNIQASGLLGLEYMRQTPNGSGVLYINTDIDSVTAIQTSTYQSYKLQLDDLIRPSNISGYNFGITTQSYIKTRLL